MRQSQYGLADQVHLDHLKRKVVISAVLSGIFALITQITSYHIQTEVSHDFIGRVQQELNASAAENVTEPPPPNFVGMSLGIVFSLAVLALGFFGAARENNVCVLGYVLGSICSFCCGCFVTCILLIAFMTLGLFVPAAESQLRDCDASVFCPLSAPQSSTYDLPEGLVADRQSVDCLSASIWPEQYERRFSDFGEVLPASCPTTILFLNCSLLDANLSSPDAASHVRARAESWTSLVTDPRRPRTTGTGGGRRDQFASALGLVGTTLGRASLPSNTSTHKPPDTADSSTDQDDEQYQPPPMPADPLTSCFADRVAMENFHEIAEELPGMWSSLRVVFWIGIFTGTISVVLAFFSLLWGTQLRTALNRRAISRVLVPFPEDLELT